MEEPQEKPDTDALGGDAPQRRPRGAPDPYRVEAPAARPPADAPSSDAPPHAGAASARFSSELRNGIHLITFSRGDVLDAYYIEQLGDDLAAFAQTVETPRLVIEMDKVNHLSSAALGMLVTLKSTVEGRGGKICLANLRDELWKIFKLTKLHKVLKIHDSTEAAVNSLSPG